MPVLAFPRPSRSVAKRLGLRSAAALPRAWHLLSLDAPTVAVTWCAAFLIVSGVPLTNPLLGWPVLFLGLATWLCYVGDRTLDARRATSGAALRERHLFYGMLWATHRTGLLVAVSVAAAACAAIALGELARSLLCAYALLTAAALLYFAFVHWGSGRASRAVAKEAIVALIFGLGCVLPAINATHALALGPVGALFAAACWLNCVAIERWEGGGSVPACAHPSTRWAARHLAQLLNAGAASALVVALLARRSGPGPWLAFCLALSFVLLGLLERSRARIPAAALRVLADVALLTPALGWALSRLAR